MRKIMEISITINQYHIQSIYTSSLSSLKNTKQNLEGQKASYQETQEKENKKLDKSNDNIEDKGDELRDGLIISASLKKQIEAINSKKDNQEDNTQTSFLAYNRNGLYNSI